MRYVLSLFLIFICSNSFADVSYEIIKKDIDENGNIRVYTQYKVDGVEVQSNYPPIDGKHYFVTRYDYLNFVGLEGFEIEDEIEEQIKSHAEQLVARSFVKNKNEEVVGDGIGTIVGKKGSIEQVTIDVDTDQDNRNDSQIIVKTDGTFIPAP